MLPPAPHGHSTITFPYPPLTVFGDDPCRSDCGPCSVLSSMSSDQKIGGGGGRGSTQFVWTICHLSTGGGAWSTITTTITTRLSVP